MGLSLPRLLICGSLCAFALSGCTLQTGGVIGGTHELLCLVPEVCTIGRACSAGTCDDGVFCNGVEVCNAGRCEAGTPPCDTAICDEKNQACKECEQDTHCDDGIFCNGDDICVAGSCVHTGNPCKAGTTCDAGIQLCVGCASDNDCPDTWHGTRKCLLDNICADEGEFFEIEFSYECRNVSSEQRCVERLSVVTDKKCLSAGTNGDACEPLEDCGPCRNVNGDLLKHCTWDNGVCSDQVCIDGDVTEGWIECEG